jgi:hypothetical protein
MDSEVESPVDELEAIEEVDDTELGDAISVRTGRIDDLTRAYNAC